MVKNEVKAPDVPADTAKEETPVDTTTPPSLNTLLKNRMEAKTGTKMPDEENPSLKGSLMKKK